MPSTSRHPQPCIEAPVTRTSSVSSISLIPSNQTYIWISRCICRGSSLILILIRIRRGMDFESRLAPIPIRPDKTRPDQLENGRPSTPHHTTRRVYWQLSRALPPSSEHRHHILLIPSCTSLLFRQQQQQQQSSRKARRHRQTILTPAARRREYPCAARPRVPPCSCRF